MIDEYSFLLLLGAGALNFAVDPSTPWTISAAKGTRIRNADTAELPLRPHIPDFRRSPHVC
jgi:hypothetical protein